MDQKNSGNIYLEIIQYTRSSITGIYATLSKCVKNITENTTTITIPNKEGNA